jgi:hypothetical protein
VKSSSAFAKKLCCSDAEPKMFKFNKKGEVKEEKCEQQRFQARITGTES